MAVKFLNILNSKCLCKYANAGSSVVLAGKEMKEEWKRLLNEEALETKGVQYVNPTEGLTVQVNNSMVKRVIKNVMGMKAPRPPGNITERLKIPG